MFNIFSFFFPNDNIVLNEENKVEGFEIYGQFRKFSEFVIDERYEFQSQKTKCCIEKLDSNNNFEVWFEKDLTGYGGASSIAKRFSNIWIIDDFGLHSK
jgi:hypothetical protein